MRFLQLMSLAAHLLWLLPAYVITLGVSCKWYQEIAKQAHQVSQEQHGSRAVDGESSELPLLLVEAM